jgi:tetratricopeptide (TPR) repeat protein
MAKRYFNWTLVVVLVVGSGVFAAAVFALHRWQVSTRAEQALPEGIQAYEQKDWDAAAGRLGRYLGMHGDDVPVLLKYAEAQIKRRPATQGHIDQAINTYRSVLRFDPNNTQAAKGLVELYLMEANWGLPTLADAEAVASEFLQRKDDPTLARMLALAMSGQGKVTEAQTTLERLVKAHPDDALAYEMLGNLAEYQGADANRPAASWFDEAVTVNPQLAVAYLVRAEFFLRTDDRDKAMADLAQAEKCDLSDYDVRLRLATTLTRINDLERARGHLKVLQAQDPTKIGLWKTWRDLAQRSGSLEEMATVADMGLKALGSERWDFMPAATEAFIYAGRTDQASDCIAQMRAKELIPDRVAYLEGLLFDKQGRLRDAVLAWQRSLSLDRSTKKNPGTRIQLAAALERLGDLPSAISQLRSLTSEWPDYVEGHVRLARYLIQTGDPADALKEVEKCARGNPEASMVEVQARILLASQGSGSTADRERQWQKIDELLQELDKKTGGNPQVRLLQAQAAVRRGKPAEAAQLLDAVGKERPSDVQVSLLQAEMLVKQGKPDEAIALLRTAVEQSPQDIRPVRQMVILLDRQKDQAQCESVIKQAIARLERPEARRDLGLLLADLYHFWTREDTAQQWLTDLAQQFPNDIQVKRGLLACAAVIRDTTLAQTLVDEIKNIEKDAGWQWRYEQARVWINANSDKDAYSQSTYFKKNYYSQAVALLQENLRANLDDEDTRLMLARVHELAGQQQLALSTYREALTRSPDNPEVVQRMVLALLNAGDVDEAQKIIAEAGERKLYLPALEKLKLASQKLQWRDQLQRGAFDSAAETLKKLLERDPNDLSASLSLALISMQQGRLDEAAVLLKQLRAKAPEAVNVIEAQAQLYLRQGNSQEALRLCDNMIQTAQNPVVGYRIRARIYRDLREKDKAISDFSQVIAKDPNNAGAYVERAAYYQQIGQRNEALGDLRKALNLASIASPALKGVLSACLDSRSRALVHDAEAVLDKARIADANDLSLKVFKASFLLASPARSSIEQSQRLLREVTDAEPRYAEAWRMLSSLELRQGQPARALDTVLRGLTFNEHNKPLLLLRADTAAAYSPALAVSTLKTLMETYPGDWEIERRLAYVLYRSGGKSEARSMLNARIQAEPNSPVPVLALIELLASDNDLDGVTQQVTNWRARHPDDVDFVVTVAGVLVSGRADAETLRMAENLARATLDRDPNSVAALRVFALLTQKLGRVDESISFARRALEREPNDLVILNNLAWALCEDKGQYQEALALADRGLRVAPEYIDLIDTRGVIHYRLDHLEKAAQDFSACIELYAADAPQIVATRFHLGRVYAKMGRKSQAQEQLRQALDQQQTLEQQNRAGSLSPADMAETKSLLEQLQKGE